MLRIKWAARQVVILVFMFGHFSAALAAGGEVTFTINPDEKENLKIKKIKKFKFIDVSGEIEEIFMFREPQISLKDVRLEFFD